MSAANDLLTEIHARLSGDAGLMAAVGADGIRDRLVTGKRVPCIVIGKMACNDYSTASEAGEEHMLALEIWCEDSGRKQANEIAAMVKRLLDDAGLVLPAHHLVSLQHRLTRSRREAKTRLHVAEMRFRAVTEPVALPPA
jgi:hypothetical protein